MSAMVRLIEVVVDALAQRGVDRGGRLAGDQGVEVAAQHFGVAGVAELPTQPAVVAQAVDGAGLEHGPVRRQGGAESAGCDPQPVHGFTPKPRVVLLQDDEVPGEIRAQDILDIGAASEQGLGYCTPVTGRTPRRVLGRVLDDTPPGRAPALRSSAFDALEQVR